MNRPGVIIIISVLIFSAFCCSTGQRYSSEIITIDVLEGVKNSLEIMQSDITSHISYIVLQASEESYISIIEKVELVNDTIYLLARDNKHLGTVLKFNMEGELLGRYGSFGRGPGEYINIMDFNIDQSNRLISIISIPRYLLTFNLDGTFISKDEFKVNIDGIESFEDYTFFHHTNPAFAVNDGYVLSVFQGNNLIKGMINRSYLSISPEEYEKIPWGGPFALYCFDNEIVFWEVNNDTVYAIDQYLNSRPKYVLNTSRKRDSPDVIIAEGLKDKEKVTVASFFETKNHVFLYQCVYKSRMYHIIYDKKTKITSSFKVKSDEYSIERVTGIYNDIDGGWHFLPKGAVNEDIYFDYFYASELRDYLTFGDSKYPQIAPIDSARWYIMKDIISNSDVLDNPVLVLFRD